MIAGHPGFREHVPPENPPEVHDVGSEGEVAQLADRGITNFSAGYHAARSVCYILIAEDGTQVPAVSEKGIVVVENTDNGKIEILLGLGPFAHLQYFPPFTLIFDSVAQMTAFITNPQMIQDVDPAVCAQLLRDERAPRPLLAPAGFPGPPAMPLRHPFEVTIDGFTYVKILGKYFYKERYGSRIKESLFGDIMSYRREALRVSTVAEYMATAPQRALLPRNSAMIAWWREHKRGGRRLKTKTLKGRKSHRYTRGRR